MRAVTLSLAVGAFLTGISAGQAPSQSSSQPQTPATQSASMPAMTMNFTAGTLIRARLDKTIDAKKAQVGDQVLAQTTDDLNSVPPSLATKGCKIIGHVAEVVPHEGNSPSKIRIVFDKMILKNGVEMALPATIKAAGFGDQFNPATDSDTSTQMGGSRQSQGVGGPPVSTNSGGGNPNLYGGGRMPTANEPSLHSDAKLPFNAQGVIGMSGVSLSAGSAHDSILTARKNVKLESGIQMILKTD